MSEDPFVSASSGPSSDSSEIRRDGYGRYLVPDPDTGKEKSWTRATTFKKTVADNFGLTKWMNRMVAKGITLRKDLYALASATDLEDKKTFDEITEDAQKAAGSTTAANIGTAIHSYSEAIDRGEEPDVPDEWRDDVEAYRTTVRDAGLHFPPWGMERRVISKKYGVCGTFDRLGQITKPLEVNIGSARGKKRKVKLHPGDWVIFDLKSGKDVKYGFNEISIQLALYNHADLMFNGETGSFEEFPEGLRQDVALVFHLPAGKAEPKLYGVDTKAAWEEGAELCSRVRAWRKRRDLGGEIEVPRESWESRIAAATSKEELSQIWREATRAKEWTNELKQLGMERLKDL